MNVAMIGLGVVYTVAIVITVGSWIAIACLAVRFLQTFLQTPGAL